MILLITSRHENQLTFPKGGIRNSETSRQAAIRETFEEAGCTGHLLGSFRPTYQKKNDDKNDIDTDNDNEENEGEEMDERKEILNYEWKEDNGKRGQDWQIIGDDSDGDDAERVATKWYPLLVEREYEDWPEKNQRNRYWVMKYILEFSIDFSLSLVL